MSAVLIGEVPKNAREVYRLMKTDFAGYSLFDLRIFAKNRNGEFVATPKGISIRIEAFEDIRSLLNKAEI